MEFTRESSHKGTQLHPPNTHAPKRENKRKIVRKNEKEKGQKTETQMMSEREKKSEKGSGKK